MNYAPLLVVLSLAIVATHGGLIPTVANGLFAIPNYQTSYSVADGLTGDRKSASETRVGDVVKGSYTVLQPDNVLRTVIYTSSPITGFQAQVINRGVSLHPGLAIGGHGKLRG